jgi:asparagine synthase (glutamine-hydrolysing)
MCGIAARFSAEGGLGPADVGAVEAMTEALRHRGPDAGGLLDRAPLGVLGHRRLAIIDLAQGQQPMATADGQVWITYNGEIYNYRELRAELRARGHAFRTSSDTEAILAAYREWGDRCPERLVGMFAFALLDLPRRRLFLARDHLGKKPLYLRHRGGVTDVASELSALRLAADWDGTLDPLALAFYLRLGYVPSPWTAYRDVVKLRPGESCVVDAAGCRRWRYWDLAAVVPERPLDERAAAEAVEPVLEEALRARLVSEVPLGAFLSGGIDSGLVVVLMARHLGPGVKTVTVGFAGEPGEVPAARAVARHHRTDHAEYTVVPEIRSLLGRFLRHFGEPFADSSALPTWHVAREARRRVTVALTGDGGDESFGGYDFRFLPHRRDARLRRLVPGAPGRRLCGLLARAWPGRHDLPRALRLGTLFRNLALDEDAAFYHDLCVTPPAVADALAPDLAARGPDVEAHVRAVYRAGHRGDPLQAIMSADARFYLPEDVLVKVDRMSMAHGLEVRSPLLDRRVVELALAIPAAVRMAGGVPKAVLRRVARAHVPPEVLALPKRGFHIPLARWLREDLRRPFEEEVLAGPGAAAAGIDQAALAGLWRRHQAGSHDHGATLWGVWALLAWLAGQRQAGSRPAEPDVALVGAGAP